LAIIIDRMADLLDDMTGDDGISHASLENVVGAKALHRKRHLELHRALDELLADFIGHTGQTPSGTTVMTFTRWSHLQTIEPDEVEIQDADDAAQG